MTGYWVAGSDSHASSGDSTSVCFSLAPLPLVSTAVSTGSTFAGSPSWPSVASHISGCGAVTTFLPSAFSTSDPLAFSISSPSGVSSGIGISNGPVGASRSTTECENPVGKAVTTRSPFSTAPG